jgi:putative transposase
MKFTPVKKIRLPLSVYRQNRTVFVTISTAEKQKWFSRVPGLANEASGVLIEKARDRGSSLYAWCIMPDHVHLLVEDDDIISFVRAFKGSLVPKARALIPHQKLWQRSFYDHILRSSETVLDVAAYIFENPVRRGLLSLPYEYPFVGSEVWPNWREAYTDCR